MSLTPVARCVAALGLMVATMAAGAAAAADPAARASVAVASNFVETLEQIVRAFEESEDGTIALSAGSTGQLYAKIRNGAPYDIFLAADAERPRLLEEEGRAVPGSRFTYAVGRLVLWSADPGLVDGPETLRNEAWRHLAIASPDLAPYGRAAEQTLRSLGLWETLRQKLVQGANIGQTFQFVATGNAELGFVALSQVVSARNPIRGSEWRVPADLHEPILQDAVLLERGASNATARRFLDYIRREEAGRIIDAFGYGRGH